MTKDSVEKDGTQVEPTTEGSESVSSQQSSPATSDIETQIKALQRTVDQLARATQSNKDRAVKQTNQRLDALEGDVRQVLQLAQQKGLSVSDVLNQMDEQEERESRELLLEMARSWKGGVQPGTSRGSGVQTGVDVDAVLSDLELSGEDLRVKAFRAREFTNEAEALREAIALKKTISTKQPSEADNPSTIAKAGSASKQDELMREYTEGSKNLRGQALINYKMQMRKKGLRIS